MSTETRMTLEFLQRRLQAIQTDINDVTAMYLHAVSHKNVSLAEQCVLTLRSAYENEAVVNNALKFYERPIRKIV